ncbi:MAG: hypothetical protein ACR2NP_15675, partial [Pirellulaceae bacterium]
MSGLLLKRRWWMPLVLTCFLASTTAAQDPDELPSANTVIEDFIDALGGEMALSNLESCRIRGRIAGPVSGEMHVQCKNDNFLIEMECSGPASGLTKLVYGRTDGKWWRQNKTGDDSTRKVVENEMAAATQPFNMTNLYFRGWLKFDGQIEMIGKTSFADHDVWH